MSKTIVNNNTGKVLAIATAIADKPKAAGLFILKPGENELDDSALNGLKNGPFAKLIDEGSIKVEEKVEERKKARKTKAKKQNAEDNEKELERAKARDAGKDPDSEKEEPREK